MKTIWYVDDAPDMRVINRLNEYCKKCDIKLKFEVLPFAEDSVINDLYSRDKSGCLDGILLDLALNAEETRMAARNSLSEATCAKKIIKEFENKRIYIITNYRNVVATIQKMLGTDDFNDKFILREQLVDTSYDDGLEYLTDFFR